MTAAIAKSALHIDIKGKGRAVEIDSDMAGASMQQRLAQWRTSSSAIGPRQHPQRVSDSEVIRDAVLLLQGINGHYTQFQEPDSDVKRSNHGLPIHPLEHDVGEVSIVGQLSFLHLDDTHFIPGSTRQLLSRLGEIGWLYRRITRCIAQKLRDPASGTVELALCHHLQTELRSYDAMIALLETCRHHPSQLRSLPPAQDDDKHSQLKTTANSHQPHLTLHRILGAVVDFKLRLRMMAVMADATLVSRGGGLLSQIHAYTENGDPFVKQFASQILEDVSRPFFRFLASWIYEGELIDPNQEFFIERPLSPKEGRPASTWSGNYSLNAQMLPAFLDETFADKIFSTGRSLNYLKYACGDTEWVHSQQRHSQTAQTSHLEYRDMSGLQNNIEVAYKKASQRLFNVFFVKFKLMKHLNALKDYLLLGRGDFVDLLIEQLGPSLSRPASTLYRHTLTAILETAIRGSTSANDDAEVLGRLDARMLDYEHGELGWDVFTLEYKVDSPVDVVLDGRSMILYSKLFSHLWRIKRVEYALLEGWKRIMNEARYYNRVADLRADFHKARSSLAEMLHFVKQLQYFSHSEVIECSWAPLCEFMNKGEGDLDALIQAHTSYVNRLANKALLRAYSRRSDQQDEDSIMNNVKDAFKISLRFKDSLDALCNYALAEASRHSGVAYNSHSESRPSSALSQSSPILDVPTDPDHLAAIRKRLSQYSSLYQDTVHGIVSNLAAHPDADLRFLSCRINFSLFYLVGKTKK